VLLPQFQPLALGRARKPFSHRDWLFEIKWDGFRSVVRIERGKGRLISRNGNEFKSFSSLNEAIAAELGAHTTILDGEIVCLDADGRPQFRDLLVCEKDLEGIVAKEKFAPYQPETRWLKIRNQSYSQWAGREELFEGERSDDPDMRVWSGCVQACVVAADVS